MKTIHAYLVSILALYAFLLCGCQEDELGGQTATKRLTSIHATTSEVVKTRTLLTEGNRVVWEEGDEIGIYSDLIPGITSFVCRDLTDDGANFHTEGFLTGNTFYAIYPFNENVRPVGETQYSFLLSNRQDYRDGSFDPANCPMVAMSTTNQFRFLQTCGLIRIKLKGTMQVDAVALSSNDGTPLTGMGTVDCASEAPVFVLDENAEGLSDEIRIEESLTLSEDKETSFYFVVPPMVLQQGFTLHISNNQGVSIEKRTDKAVEVSRSVITTFATVDTDGELEEENTSDRDALIALYDATNGENWKNNENWCTDAPLDEWYGVDTNKDGDVIILNLQSNGLTGCLPQELSTLAHLTFFSLSGNNLSGELPAELTSTDWWQKWGWDFLYAEYGFDFDSYNLYLPDFTYPDQNGNIINSTEFVHDNKFTLYYNWAPEIFDEVYYHSVVQIYECYKDYGLDVLSYGYTFEDNGEELLRGNIDKYGMEWPVILSEELLEEWDWSFKRANTIRLFDKTGKLVYYSELQDTETLMNILRENLGEGFVYESTDYSADGKVHVLQSASAPVANGINVVFMGDGFSDRQIADGLYSDLMQQGMEAFFELEPYASFKDFFNIYYVDVVSKNEGIGEGLETKLSCYLGEGTIIGGNDEECMRYASLCDNFTDEEMNEMLVVVLANTTEGHGTAYMTASSQYMGDYGRGSAVVYSTLINFERINTYTLIHEVGHGFAKLADEYSDSDRFPIPESRKENALELRNGWGFYKNVDFTNNLSVIYWSNFIQDERYGDEFIGAFPGGMGYYQGVWSPTERSVMRNGPQSIGFNAPSRAAIYNRIHKLAYGEDWQFDYEEFVQWDLSRKRTTTRTVVVPAEDIEPTTPPIVYNRRWENGHFIYE